MKVIFLLLCSIMLFGCNEFSNSDAWVTDRVRKEIALDVFKKQIAILRPGVKDFYTVSTPSGLLYFSIRNIEKYANGHKVAIDIGNPNSATFDSVQLDISYGIEPFEDENIFGWMQRAKKTTHTVQGRIGAGAWSTVEVILAPSTENETGQIVVIPEIRSVYMKNNGIVR